MNIAVFVSIWSAGMSSAELSSYFQGAPLDLLKSTANVQVVEMYTPEPGDVPAMDDIPAPSIIVQIDLDDEDAARALVDSVDFQKLFADKNNIGSDIKDLKVEITEAVSYPLPGMESAPERTAALSFVVRYYGPVGDGKSFVDFYTENHPPILAKFPNIRNVLCYLPLGWQDSGEVKDDRLIIGNEVVFDDLDSLKAALQTDVLEEAMADSRLFQKYGYSTHHAMHRELIYKR